MPDSQPAPTNGSPLSLQSPTPPFGSYAAGCAQLAIKQGFYWQVWREVDPKVGRYRVNVRLGSERGPFPRFARTFLLDTPIEQASEQVSKLAWDYFTTTGYRPPSEGITDHDVERTPRKLVIDLAAEREQQQADAAKRRKR